MINCNRATNALHGISDTLQNWRSNLIAIPLLYHKAIFPLERWRTSFLLCYPITQLVARLLYAHKPGAEKSSELLWRTDRLMRYENVMAEIKGLDRCAYNTWNKIKSVIKFHASGYEANTSWVQEKVLPLNNIYSRAQTVTDLLILFWLE